MLPTPICEVSREGSKTPSAFGRTCPVCQAPAPGPRAQYCSRACQQRAYRLRQLPSVTDLLTQLSAELARRGELIAQTVYECPRCEERLLGLRRCDDCNLMCRKLGLGGVCGECDTLVLVSELLGLAS